MSLILRCPLISDGNDIAINKFNSTTSGTPLLSDGVIGGSYDFTSGYFDYGHI
jgi:hypothetical protein